MRKLTGNWIALAVFTAIAVYLSWLIIAPFIEVIIWAAVLAVVSYPVYLRWRKRGRGPAMAAFATTLFVVLVIVIPLILVGMMLVNQLPQAVSAAQNGFHVLLDPESRVFKFVDEKIFDLDQLRDRQFVGDKIREFTSVIGARTINIVGGLLGLIVQMFFVLFTLYYMLKDADRIVPVFRDALPLERAQAEEVFVRSREIISASLNGVLVISAIQGALGGIAFAVLGLPSPVMWGVVMFLFSMIPLTGAAIVWVPAVIYLFATGSPVKAVILIIWGGGVIGMIDNLLRPRLVGERTRLHELVVFFSVLGGLQVFGVLGLVVGPVVVAIGFSLLEVFKRLEWGAPVSPDGQNPSSHVIP